MDWLLSWNIYGENPSAYLLTRTTFIICICSFWLMSNKSNYCVKMALIKAKLKIQTVYSTGVLFHSKCESYLDTTADYSFDKIFLSSLWLPITVPSFNSLYGQ